MDHPAAFIERYRQWSYEMRDAFQALSPDPDYRYWFDPFWVRAEPYRVDGAARANPRTVNVHRAQLSGRGHKRITSRFIRRGALSPNPRPLKARLAG